jgi:hypothetical protein
MRLTNINPRPITETGKQVATRVRSNTKNYPDNLRGVFKNISGDNVQFGPLDKGQGQEYIRFTFEISDEALAYKTNETWTLDLSNTGINLSTFAGGRVDTLAQEADRQYLAWAFLDSNFEWAGIGITRKPYSAFSAVSSGSKGSTGTFTVTNGYQFTIGARVYVHNDKGTTNLIESNYGTIASIASSTSITITLDNDASYGVNITAATGGYILQHNEFRPYIVASGSQTLYSNYYCLIGEIDTVSTNIFNAKILPIQSGEISFQETAVTVKEQTLPLIQGWFFGAVTNKKVLIDPWRDWIQRKYYLFPVGEKVFKVPYSATNPLFIDLSTTGLNGIIDTIAFQNGRQYLVWAITNGPNNAVSTIVATRKPFSAWTTFTGSGAKGSTTFQITNVTNGYQFTIGARAVVRNTVGTAPLFEYNWGTITAQTNTSLTLTLDNVANYGTAISAGTGGEVKQWDTFYPWVVSSGSHTLYAQNYALMGEIYTDLSTGNIHNAYRVDDEYRTGQRKTATDQTTAVVAATAFTFARDIPLWADKINAQMYVEQNKPLVNTLLFNHNGNDLVCFITTADGYTFIDNTGYVDLDPYASLQWQKNHTIRAAVLVLDFRVKGGMRL